jgi:hypothetical protein
MNELIIKTNKGLYGRVNITLPLQVKNPIMELQKKLGLKKAEYLRLVIIKGYQGLIDQFGVFEQDGKAISDFSQAPARKDEDGQLAKNIAPVL